MNHDIFFSISTLYCNAYVLELTYAWTYAEHMPGHTPNLEKVRELTLFKHRRIFLKKTT